MDEFKKGDRVEVISESVSGDRHLIGLFGKVVNVNSTSNVFDVDFGVKIKQECNRVNSTTHQFYSHELKLVEGKFINVKPDDFVRYMVYGTGCNNIGEFLKTEKELKEDLRKHVKDPSWTGKVIGYKLTPIYEVELTTRLKILKVPKIKSRKKK